MDDSQIIKEVPILTMKSTSFWEARSSPKMINQKAAKGKNHIDLKVRASIDLEDESAQGKDMVASIQGIPSLGPLKTWRNAFVMG